MDENQIGLTLARVAAVVVGVPLARLVWRGLIVLPLHCAARRMPPSRLRAWLLKLLYFGPSRQNQELRPRFSWRDPPYYGRGSLPHSPPGAHAEVIEQPPTGKGRRC